MSQKKPQKITRVVRTEEQRKAHIAHLASVKLPYTSTEEQGVKIKRSISQNSLQHKWLTELAAQGDMTYEEYRGYCKLHFGVPILRRDWDWYREIYDEKIKHLPYEKKILMMMTPIDAAVTRDMSKKQMDEYLTKMQQHFVGQGFVLTEPKEGLFYE